METVEKMERTALADKILILGIDGMDPRFTNRMLAKGQLPNIQKLIDAGSAREDLMMLGALPPITPPMWTTLATGAYPMTHGITCFFAHCDKGLDYVEYALNSDRCQAEQLWNCFVEAGKKTLVWHWPGSSWPPTSDSPLLHVVDGTSPGSVNMSNGQVEGEIVLVASVDATELAFKPKAACDTNVPCVITDLEVKKNKSKDDMACPESPVMKNLIVYPEEGKEGGTDAPFDAVVSPIREAQGWTAAPAGAKEFIALFAGGLIRRPCLLLANEQGVYDQMAMYHSKKDSEPLAVLQNGEFRANVLDKGLNRQDQEIKVNKNIRVLEIKPDGSYARIWFSAAMDSENSDFWHPRALFEEITEHVGYPTPTSMVGGADRDLITKCMAQSWTATCDWQAASLLYLIEHGGYEVIFSHMHNIDLQSHMISPFLKAGHKNLTAADYVEMYEAMYVQTDAYLGKFVHLLDEGWTILVVSDHALVCSENKMPYIADSTGVSTIMMRELGLTVLRQDENGEPLHEIDWEKTIAVQQRANHIYLNLKGRDEHGIVDPKDKYQVEEEIITKLYGYVDPKTGQRVIGLALHNKDAVILGLGGPECGDIIFFLAEGHTGDHGDSLSTTYGVEDTSVSPIFFAAGKGIKQGFKTNRMIREVDFAPTVAVLGGVRMPRDCEGAPVYQILTREF